MKAPVVWTSAVAERVLQCGDGLQLAAQVYITRKTETPTRRILCLHGWMDNCRSFHHFAPSLLQSLQDEASSELVALDLPGHGWSSHKSVDGPPLLLAESIFYVAEAVRQLQWYDPLPEGGDNGISQPPFTLVGHSMGAAISCLYAAAFPEQIDKLVLLEGAGPLARQAKDCAQHVRQSVQKRQLSVMNNKPPRIYPSLSQAVAVRMQTATKFPGQQYLSETAATELVVRGTMPVVEDATNPTSPADETKDPNDATPRGYQFRHDPRLQWPSLQYNTQEQVEAMYQAIQCPVALLLAEDGWPCDPERHQRTIDMLRPAATHTLPGSHHFHADPDTAEAVVAAVAQFLQGNK